MSKRTIILIFSAVALMFVSYLSFKNDRDQEQEPEPEDQEQEPEQEPEAEMKVIKPKKSKLNEPIQEVSTDNSAGEN